MSRAEREPGKNKISLPVKLAVAGLFLLAAAFADSKIKPDQESNNITIRERVNSVLAITGFGLFISGLTLGGQPKKKE